MARLRWFSVFLGVALVCGAAARIADAALPAQESDGTDAAKLYSAGCRRLADGDAAAAIDLLRRSAELRPLHSPTSLKLAEAYADDGRPAEALRTLEDALAQRPDDIAVRVALARAHAAGGDWRATARVLEEVESRLDAGGVLLLGRAWRQNGDLARTGAVIRGGLERFPKNRELWLEAIDTALARKRYGLALRQSARATARLGPSAALHWRAAQAYYGQGAILGATRVRRVRGGRAGQFHGNSLLVEHRGGRQQFLCCPEESALYQLRLALDGGLDAPEAHLLHARIWKNAGRPKAGFGLLKALEPRLLDVDAPDRARLDVYAELALAAGALEDYLRYSQLRARAQPKRRSDILHEAFLTVAERYNERGEDGMYRVFLRRAVEARPGKAALLLRWADAEWDARHHETAAGLYRRVLALEPGHAASRRMLERLVAWEQERETGR